MYFFNSEVTSQYSQDIFCPMSAKAVYTLCYATAVGIKYIPLRTPGGELIPESGLFLKIKKEEEKDKLERQGGTRQRRKKLSHQKGMVSKLEI